MKLSVKILASTIVVTLFVSWALAQGGGRRVYNPSTEMTVKGTVEEVMEQPGRGGGARTGTHLMLKTDSGTMNVHVGPTFFLTQRQVSFAKGDQIEVTGSKVGADTLIAREIKKGDKTLTLRDKQGTPAWAGGRQGRNAPPQQ